MSQSKRVFLWGLGQGDLNRHMGWKVEERSVQSRMIPVFFFKRSGRISSSQKLSIGTHVSPCPLRFCNPLPSKSTLCGWANMAPESCFLVDLRHITANLAPQSWTSLALRPIWPGPPSHCSVFCLFSVLISLLWTSSFVSTGLSAAVGILCLRVPAYFFLVNPCPGRR